MVPKGKKIEPSDEAQPIVRRPVSSSTTAVHGLPPPVGPCAHATSSASLLPHRTCHAVSAAHSSHHPSTGESRERHLPSKRTSAVIGGGSRAEAFEQLKCILRRDQAVLMQSLRGIWVHFSSAPVMNPWYRCSFPDVVLLDSLSTISLLCALGCSLSKLHSIKLGMHSVTVS